MNSLIHPDKSFPGWLTMSSAWEATMDDPGEVKAVIGRNLRHLREGRGLSRRALARLSHASLATLKDVEQARTLPEIGLIWRLAQIFDVPCTAFLAAAEDS